MIGREWKRRASDDDIFKNPCWALVYLSSKGNLMGLGRTSLTIPAAAAAARTVRQRERARDTARRTARRIGRRSWPLTAAAVSSGERETHIARTSSMENEATTQPKTDGGTHFLRLSHAKIECPQSPLYTRVPWRCEKKERKKGEAGIAGILDESAPHRGTGERVQIEWNLSLR